MARIEHAMGVRASYLRPPGEFGGGRTTTVASWGTRSTMVSGACSATPCQGLPDRRAYDPPQRARLCEASLEIVALGHEVGLHNDFLQLSRVLERPVPELISEELAFFRDAGVDVTGSAARARISRASTVSELRDIR